MSHISAGSTLNFNVHDWIKSVSAVVQSIAVAAGVCFGIQEYRDANQKREVHALDTRRALIDKISAKTREARAYVPSVEKVIGEVAQSDKEKLRLVGKL